MPNLTATIKLDLKGNAPAGLVSLQKQVNALHASLARLGVFRLQMSTGNSTSQLNSLLRTAQTLRTTLHSLSNVRVGVGGSGGAGAFAAIGTQATQASLSVRDFARNVRNLSTSILALAGISGAGFTLGALVREGIDFVAQIERGQIGIAATLLTFKEFRDEQGRLLSSTAAWNAAMNVAGEAQMRLQSSAFRTTATFKELEKGFGSVAAAAGTQKASIADMVKLTETVSNFAVAVGMNLDTAYRQVAMSIMGVSRVTGQFGAFLRTMKIDNAQLRSWRDQGIAVEMLQKKLEEFARIGPIINKTFVGALSNVKDAIQQLSGAALRPMMEALKHEFEGFVERVSDVTPERVIFDPKLLASLTEIGTLLGEIITKLRPVLDGFFALAGAILKTGAAFASAFLTAGPVLGRILEIVAWLIDKFGAWALTIWAAEKAFRALAAASALAGLGTAGGGFLGTIGAVMGRVTGLTGALGGLRAAIMAQNVVIGGAVVGMGQWLAAMGLVVSAIGAIAAALVIAVPLYSKWVEEGAANRSWQREAEALDAYRVSLSGVIGKLIEVDEARKLMSFTPEIRGRIVDEMSQKNWLPGFEAKTVDEAIARLKAIGFDVNMVGQETADSAAEVAKLNEELRKLNDETAEAGMGRFAAQMHKATSDMEAEVRKYKKLADESGGGTEAKYRELAEAARRAGEAKLGDVGQEAAESFRNWSDSLDQVRQKIAELAAGDKSFDAIKNGAEGVKRQIEDVARAAARDYLGTAYMGKAAAGLADVRAQLDSITQGLGEAFRREFEENTLKLFRAATKEAGEYEKAVASLNKIAVETADDGIKAQADALREQIDAIVAARVEAGRAVGRSEEYFTELQQAGAEARLRVTANETREKAILLAAQVGDWRKAWDAISSKTARTVSELRAQYRRLAETILESRALVNSTAAGFVAGWADVMAELPTAAESAARQVKETWDNLGRAFDDGFYALFSGKVDSLKDVWQGFVDSMLRSFSKSVTDMVQRWIAGLTEMGDAAQGQKLSDMPGASTYDPWTGQYVEGAGTGATGTYGGGGAAFGAIGTGLGAGMASAGLYTSLGGDNAAIGAFGGLVGGVSALALASLGSMAGPIGALIGAIVGLLLSALVGAKETAIRLGERILPSGGSQYGNVGQYGGGGSATDAILALWRQNGWDPISGGSTQYDYLGYGGGPRLKGGDIPFGPKYPGEEWDADTPIRQIPMAFKTQLRETAEGFISQFADIFEVADPTTRALFTKELGKKVMEYMNTFDVKIHAGSEEDFKYNVEKFFSTFLPNQFLAAGFGRTIALPETAGIQEFLDHGEEPTKKAAGKLWDPTAPIPMMLAGLGVTAERIQQLAEMVGNEDPQILIDYIRSLVGVLSEMRSLRTELSKSREELFAELEAEAAQSPADLFRKNSADLVGRLQELSLYTGDEQMKQAQEVLVAIRERWEAEKKYIAQIKALIDQIGDSIEAQKERMRTSLLSPAAQEDELRQRIFGTTDWGPTVAYDWQTKIFDATTPEDVQKYADELQRNVDALFQRLAERIRAATELLATIDDLLAGNWSGTSGTNPNSIAGMRESFEAMNQQWHDATALSGDEQIAAIRKVTSAAQDMYNRQLAMIQAIDSNLAALHDSIAKQKWDIDFADMDPTQKADSIYERINALRERIRTATSPEEVQALTSEIQGLISQYLGLFAEDDPNRAAAKDWAKGVLDDLEAIAREAYETMRKALTDLNAEIQAALRGAATMLGSSIEDASDEIDKLNEILDLLGINVSEKLGAMVDEIIDTNDAIMQAIEEASGLFTEALIGGADALDGPLDADGERSGGFTTGAREAGDAALRLADNADAAGAALGALPGIIDALASGDTTSRRQVGGGGMPGPGASGSGVSIGYMRRLGSAYAFAKGTGV